MSLEKKKTVTNVMKTKTPHPKPLRLPYSPSPRNVKKLPTLNSDLTVDFLGWNLPEKDHKEEYKILHSQLSNYN